MTAAHTLGASRSVLFLLRRPHQGPYRALCARNIVCVPISCAGSLSPVPNKEHVFWGPRFFFPVMEVARCCSRFGAHSLF